MNLCELGHVASTAELLRRGVSRRSIARLGADASVRKISRGMFACAHLAPELLTAGANGARLDCVSVLRRLGIWAGHDYRLHLRMPPHGNRPALGGAIHWSSERSAGAPLAVSVTDALAQAMGCLPPDDVVASLESAVHLKLITTDHLDALLASAPRRLRAVLDELEVGAQSGPETHVRLRLRRSGYRVESQVYVPGVGHLDNVIEDCAALETDGRTYHLETFEVDRLRDIDTEWFSIRVLRVPATFVFSHWALIKETLDTMVADAQAARAARGLPLR